MSKPDVRQLAASLGITIPVLYALHRKGLPLGSLKAARRWLQQHDESAPRQSQREGIKK